MYWNFWKSSAVMAGLMLGTAGARAETWALVVGIDEYQRPDITRLTFATADAKLFATALNETLKVPLNNIFLLTSGSKDPAQAPVLSNIIFRLDSLRKTVAPGDTVVFYFAGHGISVSDEESYLLPAEADSRTPNTLAFTCLKVKALNEFLNKTPAQRTLIVLDACRNDPSSGRGNSDNLLSEGLARSLVLSPQNKAAASAEGERSQATLFACGMGERSYEWPTKQHGFFTYFLVEGLNQGSADASGNVTLGSLASFLQKEVKASTSRELAHPQSPTLRYEGPGPEHWVLASGRPSSRAAAASGQDSAGQELVEARAAKLRAEQEKKTLEIEKARLEADKARLEEERARLAAENQRLVRGQTPHPGSPLTETKEDAAAAVLAGLQAGPTQMPAPAAQEALALAQAKAEATQALQHRLEAEKAKLDAEISELQRPKTGSAIDDALAAAQQGADKSVERQRAEADQFLKAALEAEAAAEKKLLELQRKNEQNKGERP